MNAKKRDAKKCTALVVRESLLAYADDQELLMEILVQSVTSLFMTIQELAVGSSSIQSEPDRHDESLWLYFPGTRKPENRILMVSHIDTVRNKQLTEKDLQIDGNIITARGGPLGADDRAGVAAMVIMMREFGDGHSYLFTDLEECGGHGAMAAAETLRDELGQHAYAIEPDRYGDGQAVFYDETDGEGFEEYLGKVVPEFRFGFGSYTDIADICPMVGICGVNVSVGYMHQHTHNETLFIDAWERGLGTIRRLLKEEEIPKFIPNPSSMIFNRWTTYYKDDRWLSGVHGNGKSEKISTIFDDNWRPDENGDYWHLYNDGFVPIVNAAGDVVDYLDCKMMDKEDWDLVDEHGAIDMIDMEMM